MCVTEKKIKKKQKEKKRAETGRAHFRQHEIDTTKTTAVQETNAHPRIWPIRKRSRKRNVYPVVTKRCKNRI